MSAYCNKSKSNYLLFYFYYEKYVIISYYKTRTLMEHVRCNVLYSTFFTV